MFISFPNTSMEHIYNLIASSVHGNALGVVLEPVGVDEYFADFERPTTWQIRIGPLVADAVGPVFPKEDYDQVVRDLAAFCTKNGIEAPLDRVDGPPKPEQAPEGQKHGLL